VDIPLPWERLLWSGRPSRLVAPLSLRERYVVTDFRVVVLRGGAATELAMQDIAEVHRSESALDHFLGTSTLTLERKRTRNPEPGTRNLVLRSIRDGAQLAAVIELLAGDPRARLEPQALAAALAWKPQPPPHYVEASAAAAAVLIAVAGVAISLHGKAIGVQYGPDDAIYPNGVKNDRATIVAFMRNDVMPWARETIGPLKGGADKIKCETCHGRDAEQRDWKMPGVAALPKPDLKERGWERYGGDMDEQMRNAIYGYAAESDKQRKATYMREVVMPGMARLLHRHAYDFTQPYEYNRQRAAFGCYHCHKVK
jgi:hypothetical protein